MQNRSKQLLRATVNIPLRSTEKPRCIIQRDPCTSATIVLAATVMLTLTGPSTALAQGQPKQVVTAPVRTAFPEKRGLKLTDFPRLVKLADNIYGYEEIRAPGFTTVSLIVVGTKGVLIADGQGSVQATQAMLDKIKTVTAQPVRWYVVGSDHGDHTAGNSVLPAGITYVVSAASKAQLEKDKASADAANEKAASDAKAAGVAAATPRTVIVPSVAMTGNSETIDVGGTKINVLNLGRAHTGGDLMVYLPRENILFMSEVYLNRVFPAMRSAYPTEWVATIDRALALNAKQYVPGHGFIEEPKASREELVAFRQALLAVIAEVTRLHNMGLPVDDAIKQANWGEYKDWFLTDQQAATAVRKVYEQLDGKLK